MGFSMAAVSVAACEAPVRKAIPHLNKPVEITPGIPNYYASTYTNGSEYCPVLVKTREGRPIKIEPNALSGFSGKGTTAQAQASVLSLYDTERLTGPLLNGQAVEWAELDNQVRAKLERIASDGGKVRLISKTILSPSTKAVIEIFRNRYPGSELIQYDPVSSFGILKANQQSFNRKVLPSYYFDKANVIVNFGADFLGTWISPLKFSADFSKNRKLGSGKTSMSRLYQYESNLSITGSNADYRVPIKPSEEGLLVAKLYNLIAAKAGNKTINVPDADAEHLSAAADQLWMNRGKSLVISGSNDSSVQVIINGINYLLGNYGQTIDLSRPVYLKSGDDEKMNEFISDLNGGNIQGVIFLNCNPVYDYYKGAQIQSGLQKVNLKASTSDRMDETASEVDYVAPENHFLESWNDAQPAPGYYSLVQPTISPLFDTRQSQVSLLTWAGSEQTDYYEFVKDRWKSELFPKQSNIPGFDQFFDQCLHDGVFELDEADEAGSNSVFQGDIAAVGQSISSTYKSGNQSIELAIYDTATVGDGSQANNPWLQELSDPITKACWENYLSISQSMALELGIEMEESRTQLVELNVNGTVLTLPALIQPGQAKGTVGLSVGYGRTKAGRVADNVGVDAYPLIRDLNNAPVWSQVEGVQVKATGQPYDLARTQTHQTFMERDFVVQESTLSEYQKDPAAGRHNPYIVVSGSLESKVDADSHDGKVPPRAVSLWKGHTYNNHHWAMAIDMNSCTGCSACIVACQAENNVPVVGKQEVINRREMAWLRIDRYYSSKAGAETNQELEIAAENPEVTFQPMLCQHCNNAPCETVCPVSATTHSTEGLNQMTYNRCVGTRYCANNCPYKVRRFNWFKYHDNEKFPDNASMNNDLGKMVLNPDVTVRSRGVMEKCSFCVQKIQYGKLEAKKEGRRIKDGEVNTACAASCPTDAIVFGDLKDPKSKVAKLLKLEDKGDQQEINEPRAYHVLEEINVRPNIWYFTKIRNKEEA
jgi:molybdopterin-containing oxidoreductase family iron-sulfur binding subunit